MQLKNKIQKMKALLSCFRAEDTDDVTPHVYRRKLVVVGDGECGKTSLITRMAQDEFTGVGYLPTVFETQVVSVSTGQEEVELVVFDTAGQEDYDRLRPLSYTDVDVAVICFSLADQNSLTNVSHNWAPEVKYFCGKIPIILVGNKKDLRDSPEAETASYTPKTQSRNNSVESVLSNPCDDVIDRINTGSDSYISSVSSPDDDVIESPTREIGTQVSTTSSRDALRSQKSLDLTLSPRKTSAASNQAFVNDSLNLAYTSSKPVFRREAPVKHSEGVMMAQRIGALAYFETSALTGENAEEVLQAVCKAALLGDKKAKKYKPLTKTLESWRSVASIDR